MIRRIVFAPCLFLLPSLAWGQATQFPVLPSLTGNEFLPLSYAALPVPLPVYTTPAQIRDYVNANPGTFTGNGRITFTSPTLDLSALSSPTRENKFDTTLSASSPTSNIFENFVSFLTLSSGTANGELNQFHANFTVSSGATAAQNENYEAKVENSGSITAHNNTGGRVTSNAYGSKYQLENDDATAGAIASYAAIDVEAMLGGGSVPTTYYVIRNAEPKRLDKLARQYRARDADAAERQPALYPGIGYQLGDISDRGEELDPGEHSSAERRRQHDSGVEWWQQHVDGERRHQCERWRLQGRRHPWRDLCGSAHGFFRVNQRYRYSLLKGQRQMLEQLNISNIVALADLPQVKKCLPGQSLDMRLRALAACVCLHDQEDIAIFRPAWLGRYDAVIFDVDADTPFVAQVLDHMFNKVGAKKLTLVSLDRDWGHRLRARFQGGFQSGRIGYAWELDAAEWRQVEPPPVERRRARRAS